MSPKSVLEALARSMSAEGEGYAYEAEISQAEDASGGELVIQVSVRWQTSGTERAERFHAWIIPRFPLGGGEARGPRTPRR
jgi:hypothetical protein